MVFTLMELLITISVIAILVGMLLPALNKAKSAASRIACSGNLRQIGISLTIYTQQNNDEMEKTVSPLLFCIFSIIRTLLFSVSSIR